MKALQMLRRQMRARRVAPARPAAAEANRLALQEVLGQPVQTRLKVGSPDDAQEREADAVAERVMAAPEPRVQRQCEQCRQEDGDKEEEIQRKESGGDAPVNAAAAAGIAASRGGGRPLPQGERSFFEPRLNAGLAGVRIHADAEAARLAQGLNARAFTVGGDVYFGAGEYRPGTCDGRRLLAHELAHVQQQRQGDAAVRRVIELRPPGRGEASAFDRAGELIDRLNRLTSALRYTLDGRVLRYEVVDETRLNEFDRQMQALIDRAEVLPMRLITGQGYVQDNPGGAFSPALHDTWTSGYVDLDDLLASDDLGFKTQMVHFMTERAETRQYERRIGTATFTLAEFNRVHRAGYSAEERVLRDEIGDPTLRYSYSEERPASTWRVIYRSAEGYRIVKVFRNFAREIVGAETYAISPEGKRMTLAELATWRQQRAAPAPAPATP